MTLKELIELTMTHLKVERDTDNYTDYTSVTEGLGIDEYINEAYLIVIRDDYPLFKKVSLTLDTDGQIDVSTLLAEGEGTPLYIKKVYNDNSEFYYIDGDSTGKIKVLSPADDMNAVVYYMPTLLSSDTDVPAFPAIYHNALSDYATYRVLITGGASKRNAAQYYYSEFERKRKKMGSSYGSKTYTTIQNKYERV